MKVPHILEIEPSMNACIKGEFDTIIDVRSPAEYSLDHIPGAINLPVLSDHERILVGTINNEQSSFEANRIGAGLVAANIGRLLAGHLADKPRHWRPLIYCWRGGNRSSSLATVLARVGWRSTLVAGGYRAYRRWITTQLPMIAQTLKFEVIAGRTGTGKSRILDQLQTRGAQVLDLEQLANHRGSVLGLLPLETQPSQKRFDSLLWHTLRQFSNQHPVYVESESRKIGQIQLPDMLISQVRSSPCHIIQMPVSLRAQFLRADYPHFIEDPHGLIESLQRLRTLHGAQQFNAWDAMIRDGQWQTLVESLLTVHYDPSYDRSMRRNFQLLDHAHVVEIHIDDAQIFDAAFAAAATQILQHRSAH